MTGRFAVAINSCRLLAHAHTLLPLLALSAWNQCRHGAVGGTVTRSEPGGHACPVLRLGVLAHLAFALQTGNRHSQGDGSTKPRLADLYQKPRAKPWAVTDVPDPFVQTAGDALVIFMGLGA